MAGTLVGKVGIWTWFNTPKATGYGGSLYVATYCQSRDRPVVYRVDSTNGDEVQSSYPAHANAVNEVDDHNDPALLLLNTNRWLLAWSTHSGANSWSVASTSTNIDTFGAVATVTTAGANAYYQLLQNSSNRVFAFSRTQVSGNNMPQYFRTWDDDGSSMPSWSSATAFMDEPSNRPYFRWFQTSSTRFDFFYNNGGVTEADISVYHGYLSFSGNDWTAHKTDGTLVGDVDDLPFEAADFTKIKDGATDDWVILDGRVIDGTPVCIFQRAPARDYTDQYYWRAKWNGSSWDSEAIARGAEAGVSTSIEPSNSPAYMGGGCIDPANTDIVYLSRGYVNDSDFRLEQYTRSSGTWSKTADISGSTGNKNCRPNAASVGGATKVVWWQGTYNTYVSFTTDLYHYPALSFRAAEAATPVLDANFAPAGSKILLPLQEGSGTPVDLRGTYTATVVGAPTWTSAAMGYHLSGFATDKYVKFDALAAAWAAGSLPKWVAVLFSNTDTTVNQEVFTFGRSSSDVQPDNQLVINFGSAGVVAWSSQGNSGASFTAQGTPASGSCNDGNLHVLMGVEAAANRRDIYFDGITAGNNTSSLGTQSNLNQATLGAFRGATVSLPFLGNIYAFACGWAGMPNPLDLYYDWSNGRFSGMGPAAATVSSTAKNTSAALGIGIGIGV